MTQEINQNVRQINTLFLMREGVDNGDANTLSYYLTEKAPAQEIKAVHIQPIEVGNEYTLTLANGQEIVKIIRAGFPLVE